MFLIPFLGPFWFFSAPSTSSAEEQGHLQGERDGFFGLWCCIFSDPEVTTEQLGFSIGILFKPFQTCHPPSKNMLHQHFFWNGIPLLFSGFIMVYQEFIPILFQWNQKLSAHQEIQGTTVVWADNEVPNASRANATWRKRWSRNQGCGQFKDKILLKPPVDSQF